MYVMGIAADVVRTAAEGPEFYPGTLGAQAGTATAYTSPMSTTGTTAGTKTGPKVFVYVKATAATTAGQVVLIDHAYGVVLCSTTNGAAAAGQGKQVGVSVGAIGLNGFGWVQVYGQSTFTVVAATALYTALFTSATPGSPSSTVAGTKLEGVVISAINGTTGTGFLNWPIVAGAAA